jgi:hypothetical protein
MKAYHRFEWDCMDIDFMTIVDTQYYDADGNYSIDYEVRTKGELPLFVKFNEPFNVVNFPLVYNYLTFYNIDYSSKEQYLRFIVNHLGELVKGAFNISALNGHIDNLNDRNNIEGYQ